MAPGNVFHSAVIVLAAAAGDLLRAAEIPCEEQLLCPKNSPTPEASTSCRTSQFWFEAESASGAQGDVVGVTISLHFAPDFDFEFTSIDLAVCQDPLLAELVGEPVYSEEVLTRDPIVIDFVPVRDDQNPNTKPKGDGFYGHFGVLRDRSPVVGELPLMTVYYRLLGYPGERTEISFCDGSLIFGPVSCNFSGISNVEILGFHWPLLSTHNRNATLTILPGPATHPDRPPEPPEAVVYPEVPTSDEVNLRVRIGNAVAAPGDTGVPVEVFVTADVEYTGVIVPIDFDERYLRAARVEDNFLAGTAILDNADALPGAQADEGYVVIASSLIGKRRIAPAGEELHAATIYFDVLESAAEVAETRLEPRPVGGRAGDPFVIVRHLSGQAAEEVEVRGEFGGVEISPGVLAIRASTETVSGDANFDGRFDISDPISVLGYLFLGDGEPLCPPAADYDGDGQLLISDPIRMLGVLFSGLPPSLASDDGLVGCR
ncbi:MAG: hypothetical protein HY721_10745 [Planctomycetes bacterium]|nr:hypothetical protein [Planctomycetota bacterium]